MIASLLNYSHIIFSLIILILLCIKFPKKLKKKDPDWLRNNIGYLIGTSFGIGGFLTLTIGLCFLEIEEEWPSQYISPRSVGTSIFIVIIYLLVIAHHQWKTWTKDIETRYGTPQPKRTNEEDRNAK
jgi:hypothetical protein